MEAFTPEPNAPTGIAPERFSRPFRSAILVCVAVGLIAFLSSVTPVLLPQETRIDIPRGYGSRDIGAFLRKEDLLRSKWAFVLYATAVGKASSLKSGSYAFGGMVTIPELVNALAEGEQYPNERVITIPEGWDERDIGGYFATEGITQEETWWNIAGYPAMDYRNIAHPPTVADYSSTFSFLRDKPTWVGLEGYLYPDTYRIWRDATPEDILSKMLENFDRKLTPELRATIALQKKTIFAVVTIASLVEKESSTDTERPVIAGILWKRLELGIPLQVDASVNYVTGKRETPTGADLKTPSPFNTYANAGLPLGPIANPSVASIRAAIFPERSAYLYYLHAPNGRIVYSKTLEEHSAARAKYLTPGR